MSKNKDSKIANIIEQFNVDAEQNSHIDSLKDIILKAIELSQKETSLNDESLDSIVAKSLGYAQYDDIRSDLVEPLKRAKYSISIIDSTVNDHETHFFINDQLIDPAIFDEERSDYRIEAREDLIENIIGLLSEPIDMINYDSSMLWKKEMIADINLLSHDPLLSIGSFVLSNTSTNEYLGPYSHIDAFESVCDDILELNKAFDKKPHCTTCYHDLTIKESVEREFIDMDAGGTVSLVGHVTDKDHSFVFDCSVKGRNLERMEHSDTCNHCFNLI